MSESKMFDFNIGVVIPAAGKGERACLPSPKQYLPVMGKQLFLYCVEEFYKLPYIKTICVVSERVEHVQSILDENFTRQQKVIVVAGGDSRHASIKNGLTALSKTGISFKVVIVHDAVRPIVPEKLVEELIRSAVVHGAAGATRPLISTVVKPMNEDILETVLKRNSYLLSETPQAFLFQVIENAYQKCSADDIENGTECLDLVLKYSNCRAKLIPGPDSLWKVTLKKDCCAVIPYLKETSTQVCLMGPEESEIMKDLEKTLKGKVNKIEFVVPGRQLQHSKPSFNIIVCLYNKLAEQEDQLAGLETVLDVEREGTVIHVVEHSSSDGMQSTSVYELHRNARNMTRQYEKLKKGVVMIHYLSQGEEKKLLDLISSLIFTDPRSFSGQTLFL